MDEEARLHAELATATRDAEEAGLTHRQVYAAFCDDVRAEVYAHPGVVD